MKSNFSPNTALQNLYRKIIIVVFLSHIIFTTIFISLQITSLIIYNICSCIFYVCIYFLVQKELFRPVVILMHSEITLFTVISCYYLGWNNGFPIYLIALTSLVYFCPFKNKLIPYLISFLEIIVFILLRLYSLSHIPIVYISTKYTYPLYLFNSICCFGIMLYAAFASKASSITIEQGLTQENSRLKDLVDHDALTHLWSRPYFTENFYKILSGGNHIIIVMADIDNFKTINDTYGHDCGDYILSELSTIIRSMCPERSGICRWGGEEFVLMFYSLNMEQILPLIELIRLKIASSSFTYQKKSIHVTMTFGVSSSTENQNMNTLIKLADERMYQGKRIGKNTVIMP